MLLAQLLHEIERGSASAATARALRESGNWHAQVVVCVDAMSVYAAITATCIKIPAEKSLWTHVQYIRELLDKGILKFLVWLDTRDMHADGLTKGAVDRAAIQAIMNGTVNFTKELKAWRPKRLPAVNIVI